MHLYLYRSVEVLVRLHGQRAENAKTLSFVTHAMARTLIAQQYGARDPLMDQIDM